MPREQDLIFVSYRHADTAAWVGRVYSILSESLDVTVFRDTEGIAFGEPIPKAVQANLDKATLQSGLASREPEQPVQAYRRGHSETNPLRREGEAGHRRVSRSASFGGALFGHLPCEYQIARLLG